MGILRKEGLFRAVSVKLLFPAFWKSGLTANQITILNFLTLNLGSVILFATGHEIIGLLTTVLGAMVDVVDGTVARAGRGSKNGSYLDTSLDWIYLMLFVGAISFHHNIMTIGYITLMAITYGNWLQYNGKYNWELPFPLGIKHLIAMGVMVGHAEWGIVGIAVTQWLRTGIIYFNSIKESRWDTLRS